MPDIKGGQRVGEENEKEAVGERAPNALTKKKGGEPAVVGPFLRLDYCDTNRATNGAVGPNGERPRQ